MDRPDSGGSDEELMRRLAASFPVEQIEPDSSSLRHLSVAVGQLHRPATHTLAGITRRRTDRTPLPRRLSPVVAIGSVVGALALGTGISYAIGVPIPAAVRSVARTVGLAPAAPTPATLGPAVTAAGQAEVTLHQALTNANSSPAEISRDTSELAHRLAQVGGDHSSGAQRVSPRGHHLLIEPCPLLTGTSPTGDNSPSTQNVCAALGRRGTSGNASNSQSGASGGQPTSTDTTTPSGGLGDAGKGEGEGGATNGGTAHTEPGGGSTQGSSRGGVPSGASKGTSGSSSDQGHTTDGGTSGQPHSTSTGTSVAGSGSNGNATSSKSGSVDGRE